MTYILTTEQKKVILKIRALINLDIRYEDHLRIFYHDYYLTDKMSKYPILHQAVNDLNGFTSFMKKLVTTSDFVQDHVYDTSHVTVNNSTIKQIIMIRITTGYNVVYEDSFYNYYSNLMQDQVKNKNNISSLIVLLQEMITLNLFVENNPIIHTPHKNVTFEKLKDASDQIAASSSAATHGVVSSNTTNHTTPIIDASEKRKEINHSDDPTQLKKSKCIQT